MQAIATHGFTERPLSVVIKPSNESNVKHGDKVSCAVEGDDQSSDKLYTWIDSATGNVIHHGAEWTIKPCCHTDDEHEIINNCVSYSSDGLLMLECHVTIGMTTARAAVVLYVNEPQQTCSTITTENS